MFRNNCNLENVVIALVNDYCDLRVRKIIRNIVELGYNDVSICNTPFVAFILYST
jgi:hypothetical protein